MSKQSPDFVWAAIRNRLETKRKETFQALRNYPRQVAGCDTHYQHLAEQRAKISSELRQLNALRREKPNGGIDEFVKASAYVDEDIVASLEADKVC